MSLSTIMGYTYRTEVELGTGGSGVVYKAWHKRLRKHVVIKEHMHDVLLNTEVRRNEVEALKNVKNACLPQVYDFMTEGDRSFTVIEYIEGESLDKTLRLERIITSRQAIKWYAQLGLALEALHKQDICHRDIKPANIMLKPDGDVCLIDFNTALVRGNDSRLLSHSKGYASPEQFEIFKQMEKCAAFSLPPGPFCENLAGAPEQAAQESPKEDVDSNSDSDGDGDAAACDGYDGYNRCVRVFDDNETELVIDASPAIYREQSRIDWKRSDIYSLGATMYHVVTGKRPPPPAHDANIKQDLSNNDRGLADIIEKSMRFDPSMRFADATELVAAIRNTGAHNPQAPEIMKPTYKYQVLGAVSAIIILAIILKRRRK